jgi:hypothetical protein
MKNSVLKAAAIAGFSVLGASSGFAQSATQTINLSSAVNASCLINGTANGGGADSGQLTIAPGVTNVANNTSIPLASGGTYNVACTKPSIVTITSANDGIKATTPGAGANVINYTALVDFTSSARTVSLTTQGGATARQLVDDPGPFGAYTGPMTIGVTTLAATGLSSSLYTDVLTVQLAPK